MKNKEKNKIGLFNGALIVLSAVLIVMSAATLLRDNKDHKVTSSYPSNENFSSYYSALTQTEMEIYDGIYESAKLGKVVSSFEKIDVDEYLSATYRAVHAFSNDHPEFFWMTNGYSAQGNRLLNSYTVEIECYQYWDYTYDMQKYSDRLQGEIEKVCKKAEKLPTDYDKVLFVHDYLIKTAEYDHDALKQAEMSVHGAACEYIYSAYGCLVNKKTVCSGYAKAFQLILNRLGIKCNYVRGNANGDSHGWNSVVLDDMQYYVDVTWDDSDIKKKDGTPLYPNDSEYEYFCITTKELEKTHTPENTLFAPPLCTAEKYNYFVYNGYLLKDYKFDKVSSIFKKQSGKNILSVKFNDSSDVLDAKADLVDNGALYNIIKDKEQIAYVTDVKHNVFKIYRNYTGVQSK